MLIKQHLLRALTAMGTTVPQQPQRRMALSRRSIVIVTILVGAVTGCESHTALIVTSADAAVSFKVSNVDGGPVDFDTPDELVRPQMMPPDRPATVAAYEDATAENPADSTDSTAAGVDATSTRSWDAGGAADRPDGIRDAAGGDVTRVGRDGSAFEVRFQGDADRRVPAPHGGEAGRRRDRRPG